MPERGVRVLLDQNIPRVVADWLRQQRPEWTVQHVNEVGLKGEPDEVLFLWAQDNESIIITYDEHFEVADEIRIISARCPTAKERQDHEEGTGY